MAKQDQKRQEDNKLAAIEHQADQRQQELDNVQQQRRAAAHDPEGWEAPIAAQKSARTLMSVPSTDVSCGYDFRNTLLSCNSTKVRWLSLLPLASRSLAP